ncbi:metallophosphoesterase, DNA ligase-associated [Tepidimonas alkaliphilus]|uniref:Metallophosphoesterase, DNA ligase-associated n=1 Tax=Tepidimonas alkaliphilus TaxID=2588942 RepID=A0A554WBP0_9BURK|nr:ligase-associated DNA damage response endonuclease PdeM [Tepidimonas alkaliphilus]TSE20989.1 metallophosphoesterase, DNA ligase-associated [Tepidimonas alkaliphilus]
MAEPYEADAPAGALRVRAAPDPAAELWLLPQRAVWWPHEATLFVADVHLGKGAALRAVGVAVPSGSSAGDLQRLGALLQGLRARRLVVLGDWLHARAGRTPALQAALQAWRRAHAGVRMVLVRGNHDDRAGDPPPELGIDAVDEPWPLGPWRACHAPPQGSQPDAAPVLCGHVHPVAVLRGPGHERLRLPCFVLRRGALVLPAFGAFTGGWAVPAGADAARAVLADGRVWPLPQRWPAPWQPVAAADEPQGQAAS